MTDLRPWVTVRTEPRNRLGPITALVLVGTLLAAVLAIAGLPHVPLPMPTWAVGVVTPTCGLTRASVALARGDLTTAWAFNPAAFLVAAFVATTIARQIIGRTRSRWIDFTPRVQWIHWVAGALVIIVWWLNQQSHAQLIMHGTL